MYYLIGNSYVFHAIKLKTLSITALGKMILSITKLILRTLSITIPRIMTISTTTLHANDV
jgi:hypothetical protein